MRKVILINAFMLLSLIVFGMSQTQAIFSLTSTSEIAAYWSPDGRLVAYLQDGLLTLSDSVTGQPLPLSSITATDITDLDWSPDGRRIAIATNQGYVLIWEITSQGIKSEQPLMTLVHGVSSDEITGENGVQRIRWSASGKYIATAGLLGEFALKMWETSDYTLRLQATVGVSIGISWNPIDDILAVTSHSGVRMLNVEQLVMTESLTLDYKSWLSTTRTVGENMPDQSVTPASWDSTGQQLVVANWYGSIWIIDVMSGAANFLLQLDQTNASLYSRTPISLMWSPDHRYIYAGIMDGDTGRSVVAVWDAKTGATLQTFESNAFMLTGIDLNPIDGRLVFGDMPTTSASTNLLESGAIRIIDTSTIGQSD